MRGCLKRRRQYRGRISARVSALIGLALGGLVLGGCSVPFAVLPMVGLPSNTPARPETPAEYPAVHDLPAARSQPVLEPEQQAKIEKDLVAARNRQASGAQKASPRQNN